MTATQKYTNLFTRLMNNLLRNLPILGLICETFGLQKNMKKNTGILPQLLQVQNAERVFYFAWLPTAAVK
jgi:hypothetical protein